MGQVVYLLFEGAILPQLQLEIILPELIKHYMQMMEVLLHGLREHNQVIQVDQTVDEA